MTKTKTLSSQSIMKGTTTLTISIILVKVIGALFKLPIANILGGTGTGFFTSAYDLYGPIESFANAGFPVAVSKMVSNYMSKGQYKDVRLVHKVSVPLFLMTGTIAFLFMIPATFLYISCANIHHNAILSALALTPTVFFVCMMSIYKGYYQGLSNMTPTATAEVIEALSKVTIGLIAAYAVDYYTRQKFGESKPEYTSAAAIIGVSCGAAIGFLYLLYRYKKYGDGITKEQLRNAPKTIGSSYMTKTLIKTAIPIGLAAIVMNIGGLIDSTLVNNKLQELMDNESSRTILLNMYGSNISQQALNNNTVNSYLYGCIGMVSTFTLIVPAITQMLGVSALPQVTAAWAKKDYKLLKHNINTVIRIASMIVILAVVTLIFMGKPILSMLYFNRPQEVNISSRIVVIMSLAMLFTAFSTPIFSMLQAVGLIRTPLKLLFIGVILKILCNYTLIGIPQINIQGAGTGTLICYIFVTSTAFYKLCEKTKVVPNFITAFIKPLISSLISAFIGTFLYNSLKCCVNIHMSTMISLCAIAVLYCLAMLLFGGIQKSDIFMLPRGKKIVNLLENLKLIR